MLQPAWGQSLRWMEICLISKSNVDPPQVYPPPCIFPAYRISRCRSGPGSPQIGGAGKAGTGYRLRHEHQGTDGKGQMSAQQFSLSRGAQAIEPWNGERKIAM